MFTRQKQTLWLLIVFLLVTFLIPQKEPLAAPYYEGKMITIVVAHGVGGGYDRMARLLAKHLPKYIPGKPTIVIQNMEGAGSLIGANYVYNTAKPDGLTLGTFDRGNVFNQLVNDQGVRFDLTKYSWIGSAAAEPVALCLRTDLPYKTFNDLLKDKQKKVYLGATGVGGTTAFCFLLKEFVGLNFKWVMYPTSNAFMLAVESKELDGSGSTYSSQRPFIERGLVRPLIRARVSAPGIENLPVDEDVTPDPKGKTLMAMRSSSDKLGRPFVAPPGTPADVLNILRDAFAKTTQDPELLNDAKKSLMDVEYISADECLKVVHYVLNQPANIVKEFRKYIESVDN